jgi:hypothetical protein
LLGNNSFITFQGIYSMPMNHVWKSKVPLKIKVLCGKCILIDYKPVVVSNLKVAKEVRDVLFVNTSKWWIIFSLNVLWLVILSDGTESLFLLQFFGRFGNLIN